MAVDYSLTITWTYFSVYVLIFLITSIVCTIEVSRKKHIYKRKHNQLNQSQNIHKMVAYHTKRKNTESHNDQNKGMLKYHHISNESNANNFDQFKLTDDMVDIEESKYELEYAQNHSSEHISTTDLEEKYNTLKDEDQKFTTAGMIQQWAKLFWRKKKVYFALLPHFFDQATDLGVIFEYYRYIRNEEDIGIDTKYLFFTSISVIIFHRIVSSVAIYNLTRKPFDVLLQLFDFLMIKCIYTNYRLQTDEPSNAQRYLQTMEATFEVKFYQSVYDPHSLSNL